MGPPTSDFRRVGPSTGTIKCHIKKGTQRMSIKALTWLLLTSVPAASALARDPANPEASVPPAQYSPVISGTKTFRPVEPLPWGDVNRRVMPKDAQPSPAPGQGKPAAKTK